MYEIKTEILEICDAFNLGSFKNSHSKEINDYIETTVETNKGVYTHYFRVKK